MRQATGRLDVPTHGQGLVEVTRPVVGWVAAQGIRTGLLTVFCRHTSASLLVQENADPTARADLETFFRRSRRKAAQKAQHTGTRRKARTTCRRTCARR